MNFLDEVKTSKEFQQMMVTNPISAGVLIKHYEEKYSQIADEYVGDRDAIRREYAAGRGGWTADKEHRHVAAVPAICIDWLRIKYGRKPTAEERADFVRRHPEFWVVNAW